MCEHAQGTDRGGKRQIVLDFSEMMLADRDSAMFLAVCGLKSIELRNCSAYLREWIAKEQVHIPQ
jgi:hypothetical protein